MLSFFLKNHCIECFSTRYFPLEEASEHCFLSIKILLWCCGFIYYVVPLLLSIVFLFFFVIIIDLIPYIVCVCVVLYLFYIIPHSFFRYRTFFSSSGSLMTYVKRKPAVLVSRIRGENILHPFGLILSRPFTPTSTKLANNYNFSTTHPYHHK